MDSNESFSTRERAQQQKEATMRIPLPPEAERLLEIYINLKNDDQRDYHLEKSSAPPEEWVANDWCFFLDWIRCRTDQETGDDPEADKDSGDDKYIALAEEVFTAITPHVFTTYEAWDLLRRHDVDLTDMRIFHEGYITAMWKHVHTAKDLVHFVISDGERLNEKEVFKLHQKLNPSPIEWLMQLDDNNGALDGPDAFRLMAACWAGATAEHFHGWKVADHLLITNDKIRSLLDPAQQTILRTICQQKIQENLSQFITTLLTDG
jgi:hypothetical protein